MNSKWLKYILFEGIPFVQENALPAFPRKTNPDKTTGHSRNHHIQWRPYRQLLEKLAPKHFICRQVDGIQIKNELNGRARHQLHADQHQDDSQ